MEEQLLTVDEISRWLGKNRRWVYRACRSITPPGKRLPHVRLGGEPRFIKTSIEKWLASQEASVSQRERIMDG